MTGTLYNSQEKTKENFIMSIRSDSELFSEATAALGIPQLASHKVDYVLPEIDDQFELKDLDKSAMPEDRKTEIPARLDSPLMAYPPYMKQMIMNGEEKEMKSVYPGHKDSIIKLMSSLKAVMTDKANTTYKLSTDIDDLKLFYGLDYSKRANIQHKAALSNIHRCANNDLSLLSNNSEDIPTSPDYKDETVSFLSFFMRLRTHMCIGKEIKATEQTESSYKKMPGSVHCFYREDKGEDFFVMLHGSHFLIYHEAIDLVFLGPKTYLEYLFTIHDVNNNINLILSAGEYDNFRDLFNLLKELSTLPKHHNDIVKFFKSYEAICLFKADIVAGGVVNWVPILDTIHECIASANVFSKSPAEFPECVSLLISRTCSNRKDNYFLKILAAVNKLEPLQFLEASSLHKFSFYAEISGDEGMHKYLKRTHTPRQIDQNYITQLLGITKKEFILSFINKEKIVPEIIGPTAKADTILTAYRTSTMDNLETLGLTWWSDIKIGKCINYIPASHPVEYAKDKGAITNDVVFGPQDSKRELTQVMETEEYFAPDFILKITEDTKGSTVKIINTLDHTVHIGFPVELLRKEKEQKPEGRIYGVGTARFKHKLSEYMDKAKEVLKYFSGSYMTMSDLERKNDLYDQAQILTDPANISVMLDIEGHNQSMQVGNTKDILEFIGNCYGEDNWGRLSHLFNNLTVYCFDPYMDRVFVSEGQRGGIEGWMNPVWSLVTLQQVKLLKHRTALDIIKIGGYSDDVQFICRQEDQTQAGITAMLTIVADDLLLGGFVVKPSQTAVSRVRATMLRTHWLNGQRSDSTLKRLMSTSCASAQRVTSDEIEIRSVSSCISSALEGSYHIKTAIYLKWYKSLFISTRLLCSLFSEQRNESMLSDDHLPERIRNAIRSNLKPEANDPRISVEVISAEIKRRISRIHSSMDTKFEIAYFNTWYTQTIKNGIDENKILQSPDMILHYSTYDDWLQELWWYILAMPNQFGGLGVELSINQVISGHSDNLYRSVYYIHRIVNYRMKNSEYFNNCIVAALKFEDIVPDTNEDGETGTPVKPRDMSYLSLLVNKWGTNKNIKSSTSIIGSALSNHMRAINSNKLFASLLITASNKIKIATCIVKVFSENYSHRVAAFYYENSIMSMINYLLAKLETTTSLITKVKGYHKMRSYIVSRPRTNIVEMMRITNGNNQTINGNTDMLSYLISRRKSLFPEITFVDIEEPLYDHMLSRVPFSHGFMHTSIAREKIFKDGLYVYRQGMLPGSTLYKGEILKDEQIVRSRQGMLVAKLSAITKWILHKSNIDLNAPTLNNQYDVVQACNISLTTLTDDTYDTLELFTPMNYGGEILHRIPNQSFKAKTQIRVFPNETIGYSVHLNQSYIYDNDIEDTNINFEYIRAVELMRVTFDDRYHGIPPLSEGMIFNKFTNIHQVQDYKPSMKEVRPCARQIGLYFKDKYQIDKQKMSLYTTAYMYNDTIADALNQLGEDKVKTYQEARQARNAQICLDFYRQLNKEHLCIDISLGDASVWTPLICRLRKIDEGMRNMDDERLLNEIKMIISDELHSRHYQTKYNVYKGKFRGEVKMIQDNIIEFSDSYQYIISYIKLNYPNVPEDGFSKRDLDMMRGIIRSQQKIVLDLYFDLASGYCMHLRQDMGQVILDSLRTHEAITHTLLEGAMDMVVPAHIRTMIIVLGPGKIASFLRRSQRQLIESLDKVGSEFRFDVLDFKASGIKFDTVFLKDEEIDIDPLVNDVKYTSFEIPINALGTFASIHKKIGILREISETYTNINAFSSPTGSESLMAQFGLFDMLLRTGIIKETTKGTSLASGRGDSLLASTLLGIKMDHYSKPALFNHYKVVPGVETRFEYDITKYDTMGFMQLGEWVHIDISHLVGKMSGLEDSLLNMMMDNKIITLRVNSIENFSILFTENVMNLAYKIHFSHACSTGLLPYHMYMIFIPSKNRMPDSINDWSEIYGFRAMAALWVREVSLTNFMKCPLSGGINSVTSLLNVTDDVLKVYTDLSNVTTEDSVVRAIKQLVRLGIADGDLHLDSRTYNHIRLSIPSAFLVRESYVSEDCYPDTAESDIARENHKGYNVWEKAWSKSKLAGARWYKIPRGNITTKEAIALSRSHPLSKERSYWKNIAHMNTLGIVVREHTSDALAKMWADTTKNSSLTDNTLSNNVREAFAVFLYARARHNYFWGLKFYLSTIKSGNLNKSMNRKKLHIYRKLGAIYHQISLDTGKLHDLVDALDNIEKTIINPTNQRYLRPLHNEVDVDREMVDTEYAKYFEDLLTGASDKLFDSFDTFMPKLTTIDTSNDHLFERINDSIMVGTVEKSGGDVNVNVSLETEILDNLLGAIFSDGRDSTFTDDMLNRIRSATIDDLGPLDDQPLDYDSDLW